jgi:hypothetical protein
MGTIETETEMERGPRFDLGDAASNGARIPRPMLARRSM